MDTAQSEAKEILPTNRVLYESLNQNKVVAVALAKQVLQLDLDRIDLEDHHVFGTNHGQYSSGPEQRDRRYSGYMKDGRHLEIELRDFNPKQFDHHVPSLEVKLWSRKNGETGYQAKDYGITGIPNEFRVFEGQRKVLRYVSERESEVPEQVIAQYGVLLNRLYEELTLKPVRIVEASADKIEKLTKELESVKKRLERLANAGYFDRRRMLKALREEQQKQQQEK